MPGTIHLPRTRHAVYNRDKALLYARQWALKRNPRYIRCSGVGGDSTNFASQCLYAGTGAMNRDPCCGWYYNSAGDYTPSWAGVQALYAFLTQHHGAGPSARECTCRQLQPGDLIQLATYLPDFHHTLVVTAVGQCPAPANILVCAHSYDSLDRPLHSYHFHKIRFLHMQHTAASNPAQKPV